jgi:hypothetical protein
MKFSELREANLSKAQIKKVHDKADDLPKNDFIKRYGKNGDAVRFATATNQVKKELGIDEGLLQKFNSLFPHVPVIGKPLPSKDSYGRGDVKTIQLPVGSFKGKKEELDDKDKETIKPIIKQLQKSVKAHGKQAKQLQKDIKDETELDEFVAPVARAVGKAAVPVAKAGGKLAYKGAKLAVKKGTPIVKKVGKEVGKAALEIGVDVAKAGGKAGLSLAKKAGKAAVKTALNPTGDRSGSPRQDRADGMSDADLRKKYGKDIIKKEEVEVTEAVSDAYVKQIARMTDRNDHFGARVELARMMKDKELMKMYDSLEKMHNMNLGGNDALTLRSKLDKNLKFRLTQKFKKDADRLMDAL